MSPSLQQIELQRARWRRAQEALGLADVRSERFAAHGLASHVPDLAARLVVLPADPEADVLDFNEAFWEWFKAPRESLFQGRTVDWGYRTRSVIDGAVRYSELPDRPDQWRQYFGLMRCGGLDVGLGEQVRHDWRQDGKAMSLMATLARFWWALDLHRDAADRYHVHGPWQLTAALVHCKDACLAHFASGWGEPWGDFACALPYCLDDNGRLTLELEAIPSSDELRELVYRIGAWIEDCFGSEQRRCIARSGPYKGEFDATRVS